MNLNLVDVKLDVHRDYDNVSFTLTALLGPSQTSSIFFKTNDPEFLRAVRDHINVALHWSENRQDPA